jgi:hypothetical protein
LIEKKRGIFARRGSARVGEGRRHRTPRRAKQESQFAVDCKGAAHTDAYCARGITSDYARLSANRISTTCVFTRRQAVDLTHSPLISLALCLAPPPTPPSPLSSLLSKQAFLDRRGNVTPTAFIGALFWHCISPLPPSPCPRPPPISLFSLLHLPLRPIAKD